MGKLRLTMAQALVKFLDNQYLEVDGEEHKFVKGIFAIFGHGNVLGMGQALEQDSGEMRVYQGRNEQGMAHVATGFARQSLRYRCRHRDRQPHPSAAAAGRCVCDPPA